EAQVTVRLHQSWSAALPEAGARLAVPGLATTGAADRGGVTGVTLDPSLEADVGRAEGATMTADRGPWGDSPPDLLLANPPGGPPGEIVVRPRPRRFEARS